MLKILWKRGEIAPDEQFLLLSTIFCYLMLDLYVKKGIRFSLRDKRLFEITKVEITRVDCIYILGVFTEKPYYSKPLEGSVVYSPTKSSSRDVSDVRINHGSLQSDWTSVLFRS